MQLIQRCLDLTTGRVHITSQNHGYAVDAQTLPSDYKEVSFRDHGLSHNANIANAR